ncbi:unnamed protein product [Angiostrongylus costaricensis]|uniref:Ig-like domain-containing protein n=1 Tax=Angiostrongylus costaricensis TaxID=334426 RepID=A0A0R3PHL8_ANGCS|nr:unnamed protein product [Angiostrongylus costaricensis]
MRTFWGRKGKSITLPCSLPTPEDNNYSLEWRKNNKLIMSAYGAEAGQIAPTLQGTCSLLAAPVRDCCAPDETVIRCLNKLFSANIRKNHVKKPKNNLLIGPND